MLMLRLFILLMLFFAPSVSAQKRTSAAYDQLREKYRNLPPDDTHALPYIDLQVKLAKGEQNQKELFEAYHDAALYHSSSAQKLKFMDSALIAAHRTCDDHLIARAYLGKGIVFYFNFKAYQPALEAYLQAKRYSEKGNDDYLKHKILYHLGVVYSYMGNEAEAIPGFEACLTYFRQEIVKKPAPNLLYNMKKGYLNSLRQLIICYLHQKNDRIAHDLITIGEREIPGTADFAQDRAYFYELRGISEYRKGQFESSLHQFQKALPALEKVDDFAWISMIYFYSGKNYEVLGKNSAALVQFKKVDSVFSRKDFVFPELRENYELLIKNATEQSNTREALHYAAILRKIDHHYSEDFHHLSAQLRDSRYQKEREHTALRNRNFNLGSLMFFMLFILAVYYFYEKEVKELSSSLLLLGERAISHTIPARSRSQTQMSEEIYKQIRKDLKIFEDEEQFLAKKLTEKAVADLLKTNTLYLSNYINEIKGVNFNTYLNELRIHYIAKKLAEDPEFLKFNMSGLADECGMASRSIFSQHFVKIYGMRPTEYIKMCREKQSGEGNNGVP